MHQIFDIVVDNYIMQAIFQQNYYFPHNEYKFLLVWLIIKFKTKLTIITISLHNKKGCTS